MPPPDEPAPPRLPPTELQSPLTRELDRLAPAEVVRLMAEAERASAEALARAAPEVGEIARLAAGAIGGGGRLLFAGAGTSGRLGALEAAECPPTFGTDPGLVRALLAGGPAALAGAVEGAEDREEDARAAVLAEGVGPRDLLVGVAASGRTPYVRAALALARERGARTALVTCDPACRLEQPLPADVVAALETGPEVLTGSTRLKAGTATKLALNAITTAAMVSLGKVHGNLMVDVRATNQKLRARARRIVRALTDASEDEAAALLLASGGSAKTAIAMRRRGVDRAEAERLLAEAGGRLRGVIGE